MIRLSTGSAAVWLFVLVLTFSGAEETLSKDKGESKGSAPLSPLAEFSRWLRKRGINDQKVRMVEDCGNGLGRGMIAREEINEGDLLFKVPFKWIITSDAAKKNPLIAGVLQNQNMRSMTWETMLLSLLLMLEDCQRGTLLPNCRISSQTSEWLPYLDILPRNFSSPMFWTPEEISELQGSQVLAMHEEDVKDTEQQWSTLSKLIAADPTTFCSACFNLDKYKWASWNIQSRALTLKGIKYLIPLADMVNYEPDDDDQNRQDHQELFLKYHKIDRQTGYAETYSDRKFPKGRPITESYGDNANHMYLRFFGFVPASNPTDCVELRFSSSQFTKGGADIERRKSVLKELGLRPASYACLRRGQAPPAEMLRFLRTMHLSTDELSAPGGLKDGRMVSAENERRVWKLLLKTAEKRLAGFTTDVGTDKALLKACSSGGGGGAEEEGKKEAEEGKEEEEGKEQGGAGAVCPEGGLSEAKRWALMVRVSEKQILKALRRMAKDKLRELRRE